MLEGLRSVIYPSKHIESDRDSWSLILGVKPYFDQPFYVGFNIGGYELGLEAVDKNETRTEPITYWGVKDIVQATDGLVAKGAAVVAPIQEVGDDIKMARLMTTNGHTFGIIENPHFKLSK